MECRDVEKIKPIDVMIEDQVKEFESGQETVCDKDLDRMMWELNHFEDEAPPAEAREFTDENPGEEELVEKKLVFGRDRKLSYTKDETRTADLPQDEDVVDVHSMNPDDGK
jgi:hypothetical protein